MKKKFCGFYTPKQNDYKKIWNDKDTIFIFDTNTLLNLYRCEEQTKDDIFAVMKMLSSRSWFPFHVCLEYQKNRINVISQSIKSLEKLKKGITSLVNSTDNALSDAQVKKHLYASLSEEVSLLKDSLSISINDFIKQKIEPRIKIKEKTKESDLIRKNLDEIIGENCGEIPAQDLIDTINTEGALRYSKKIPPGFMDEKEKGEGISFYNGVEFKDKFGDLYLWKEILNFAKNHDDCNIIFITDDSKKDWWFSHDNKTIGPSEALQTEIYFNSNIKSFRMISHSSFLYEAGEYLENSQIKQSSVDDIKEISSESFSKAIKTLFDSYTSSKPSGLYDYSKSDVISFDYIIDKPFKTSFLKDNIDTIEDIIDIYNHFQSKHEDLNKKYIELSELVDFEYDITSDNIDSYNERILRLKKIKTKINQLRSSLDLLKTVVNTSEVNSIQENTEILISNISAKIKTIKRMLFSLERMLK